MDSMKKHANVRNHRESRGTYTWIALILTMGCSASHEGGAGADSNVGGGSVGGTSSGGTSVGGASAGGASVGGASAGGASAGGTGGGSPGSGSTTSVGAGGTPGSGGATVEGSGGAGSGGSGSVGFSSNRDDFLLGQASTCPGEWTVCESFETASPGSLPVGWTETGYGTRTLSTVDSMAARGSRALQIDVAGNQGAVVGMLERAFPDALSASHFGRMFYRIEGPAPSEFVHFDVMSSVGPWSGHENAVRFASTGTGAGTSSSNWSWIYNVQPFGSGAGGEFGSEGDRSAHPVLDEWMCLEWSFDSNAQTATYFHDGETIDYLVIDTERSEIPVFSTFQVGFQKFQTTGSFRIWVDEIALDEERIGCNF